MALEGSEGMLPQKIFQNLHALMLNLKASWHILNLELTTEMVSHQLRLWGSKNISSIF